MVVDDEESYTEMLKLTLEDTGDYEVRVFNDSAKALEASQWYTPDVAILDVVMPGMSGVELAEKLKVQPRWAQTPIVFLTAVASRDNPDQQHALAHKGTVLAKPVSADNLIECIEKLLAQRR